MRSFILLTCLLFVSTALALCSAAQLYSAEQANGCSHCSPSSVPHYPTVPFLTSSGRRLKAADTGPVTAAHTIAESRGQPIGDATVLEAGLPSKPGPKPKPAPPTDAPQPSARDSPGAAPTAHPSTAVPTHVGVVLPSAGVLTMPPTAGSPGGTGGTPGGASQSPQPQPAFSDSPLSIAPFLGVSSGAPTTPSSASFPAPTYAPSYSKPSDAPSVLSASPAGSSSPSTHPSDIYEPTASNPPLAPSPIPSLVPSLSSGDAPTGRPSPSGGATAPSLDATSIPPSHPPAMTPTTQQSTRPSIQVFPSFSGLPSRESQLPTQGGSYTLIPTSTSSSSSMVPSRTVPPSQPPPSSDTSIFPTQPGEEQTTTPSRVLSTQDSPSQQPNACTVKYIQWVGDGWCDSSNGFGVDEGYNSADCLFDGGDCCELTCVSSELHRCGTVTFHCIDPDVVAAA